MGKHKRFWCEECGEMVDNIHFKGYYGDQKVCEYCFDDSMIEN